MSKAPKSAWAFAIYLVVIERGFLIIPNYLLGLFGLAETTELYSRIVGVLLLILEYYYGRAAREELTNSNTGQSTAGQRSYFSSPPLSHLIWLSQC